MKLAPFSFFLTESNAYNQAYGSAYEMGTVLRLHEKTGSSKNNNPEYKAKIAKMQEEHKNILGQLPPHLAFRAAAASSDSANAYLKSLKERRGINPQDVHEVHHTHGGISDFVGRKVDRASNPHDLIIRGRTKTGGNFTHGASLKATSGTASNNPVGAFAIAGESHGIELNTHHIWAEGRKRAGLEGKSGKEIKAVRDDPKIKEMNSETQQVAAHDHASSFDVAPLEAQKKHLKFLLKATPDLDYDYVKGEGGGSSTPHNQLEHIKAIQNAKSFTTEVRNNNVHFYDHEGRHLAFVEHRTTHGAFSSPQANAKFGTMKQKEKA